MNLLNDMLSIEVPCRLIIIIKKLNEIFIVLTLQEYRYWIELKSFAHES